MSTLFPHQQPAVVPAAGRAALARDLVAMELGLDQPVADAIARAVVEPRAARAGLKNLTRHRVDGGAVLALQTYIYPWGAVVGPDNPRTACTSDLPATGSAATPPPRPTERPGGGLCLETQSPTEIINTIETSAGRLRALDAWNESIADAGVRQPITLVPVEVVHVDGTPPVIVLMTEDGATRLANAQEYTRTTSGWELLYEFSRATSTKPRNFVSDINRIVEENTPETLTAEDVARLRCSVIPASIVLGFVPDDPDGGEGLVEALGSFKGQLHIAPPEGWPLGAQRDEQLLEALAARYVPSSPAYRWRAGLLTPNEARQEGFSPEIDDIALAVLGDVVPYDGAVTQAIRRLTAGRKVMLQTRREVAIEAAVRLARAGVAPRVVSVRRAVADIVADVVVTLIDDSTNERNGTGLRSWEWSGLEPDELHERAAEELEGSLLDSPHRIELLARGALHLALRDAVASQTRGGDEDRRSLTSVLKSLASTAWGLEVLHEALVAGRAGRQPSRVTEDGAPLQDANGTVLPISNDWLRSAVVPKVDGADGTTNTSTTTSQPISPNQVYARLIDSTDTALDGLEEAIEEVFEYAPDDQEMWRERGIVPARATRMLDRIREAEGRIQRLKYIGEDYSERASSSRPAGSADDEGDL